MSTTTTIQSKAGEARGWFEMAHRPDGSGFIRTKDEAPEWVTDLVRDAHGGSFLPDDWRYETIRDALEWIADSDDPEDQASEFADDAVDVYTGARIAWLGSNLNRASYCDEAIAELGGDAEAGIIDRIGYGQYMEAHEVYGLVLSALEDASAV